jgi:hypothetical protein
MTPSLGARTWIQAAKDLKKFFDQIPDEDPVGLMMVIAELWSNDEERVVAAEQALAEIIDGPEGHLLFDFAERTNGDSAFFSIMLLIVCSATHHAIGKCFK